MFSHKYHNSHYYIKIKSIINNITKILYNLSETLLRYIIRIKKHGYFSCSISIHKNKYHLKNKMLYSMYNTHKCTCIQLKIL